MNLNTSLMLIGQRFGFEPDELIAYAAEDAIGGYHSNGALAKWPMGSLWEVEGKTLYALVRALKCADLVEIGTHRGASATHIIAALDKNYETNTQTAVLNCCDLGDYGGDLIPEQYRAYAEIRHINGIEYLAQRRGGDIGLIFEDASHDAATTEAIARLAQRKLAPGGVLVVHDAAHFLVGAAIRAGLDAAQLPGGYGGYLCEPSDCGLAVWRKALDITQEMAPAELGQAITEAVDKEMIDSPYPEKEAKEEPPAPKVKRTPKKKAIQ